MTRAVVIAALFSGACATTNPLGRLEERGFVHTRYDYGLAYEPGTRRLIGSEWRLENFQGNRDGELGTPKRGSQFQYTLRVDANDDGSFESHFQLYTYDLFFQNRRDDGQIWVRTVPLSGDDWDRDLRVIARNYVDRASGGGSIAFVDFAGATAVSRTFASRVLSARALIIYGREAYEVTFEVANVEQLELSPNARWMRGRVLFVRTELAWSPALIGATSVSNVIFPVVMVVGYANAPEEYERWVPTFEDVVSRIRFGDALGLRRQRDALLQCAPAAEVLRIAVIGSTYGDRVVSNTGSSEHECISEIVNDRTTRHHAGRAYGARIIRSDQARAAARTPPPAEPPLVPSAPDPNAPPTTEPAAVPPSTAPAPQAL